jgi:antibiotic biosynthesis monooxygenase (ABM) superfamily enzyme
MTMSILLVSAIFATFLGAIMFILQLPVMFAFIATLIFILLQYLIGPAIVRGSTHLHYLKPGENQWLESTVKELADKGGTPMTKHLTPSSSVELRATLP